MRLALLAALMTGIHPAADAASPAPPAELAGTWKGRIGPAEVMLCITDTGDAQTYYLRHRRGITLAAPNEAAGTPEAMRQAWQAGRLELLEQEKQVDRSTRITGRWQLAPRSGTEAAGTWSDPAGTRSLPITLTRLPGDAGHDPRMPGTGCGPAFYEPLRAAVRVKASPARLGDRPYRMIESEQATAFEVPPDTPHAARLNRFTLDWVRDQAARAFDCDLMRGGPPSPLGATLEPVWWTDRFLVMRDTLPETYCGGAHGFWSIQSITWSVPQGRVVDTWTWLRGGEKALEARTGADGQPARSPLFRLLARHHPRNAKDDDCREVMDHMSVDAPTPGPDGLTFQTSFFHAMRACGDEVKLTWEQVAPHLSAAGRAVREGR